MDSETTDSKTAIAPARIVEGAAKLVTGLRISLTANAAKEIPALWQTLSYHFDKIPLRQGTAAYGLCIRAQQHAFCFDYMAGVAVSDFSDVPVGWGHIAIPAQRYAVFSHGGPVARLRETIDAIFDQWLPQSGYKLIDGGRDSVYFYERYGERFNPRTGHGDMEIWLPVQ